MVALDSFYPMTGVTTQLAQWQKWAPNYVADGVIAGTLSAFSVAQHAPPGMSVDVATGQCFIQGVFGESGATKTLTIATADNTNPRIDRVVLRCDTVAQDLEVLVRTGVAAVSPSPPALVRSATQTDYSLCQVLVGTTVTSIVTANITDERQYASPRGISIGRNLVAASTIEPYGPSPLTEGMQQTIVGGTTSITNIAVTNAPPKGGATLLLEFTNLGCTVVRGGNISIPRNYVSGTAGGLLALFWDGSAWVEIARSGEQAPAHQYLGNPTGTVAAVTFASIVTADLPQIPPHQYLGNNTGATQAAAYAIIQPADLPAYGTFSPASTAIVQGGATPTFTNTVSRFAQFGHAALIYANWSITSGGTAGQAIAVTLPSPLIMAANQQSLGSFTYNHGGVIYVGTVQFIGATSIQFITTSQNNYLGATPSINATNGDTISFNLVAELA